MEMLGTKVRMSTAFHPQADGQAEKADGQAEKANSIVETYLLAYNSARHAATKMAPFEADLGRIPRLPIDLMAPRASERQ